MLKLLGSKVLIKVDDVETKTSSGLVLPSTVSNTKTRTGTVVAIGTGDRNSNGEKIPMEVKVDDKVMYNHAEYAITEVDYNGSKHILIDERDVIGIL